MRISLQTLLMLLVCFLSGIIAYAAVGLKYQQLSLLQAKNENSNLLARDIEYLEIGLTQWFVNIDLFFNEKQGYLASGIASQAEQLQKLLKNIEDNFANVQMKKENKSIQKFGIEVNTIKKLIIAISKSPISNKGSNTESWIQTLEQADNLGYSIYDRQDSLALAIENYKNLSEKDLQKAKNEFSQIFAIALMSYIFISYAVWRWASANLVKPIMQLNTCTFDKSENAERFHLDNGPREIIDLGKSFGDFTAQINRQKDLATEAMERVSVLMDTAPMAIITTDVSGKIRSVNRKFSDVFNYTTDQMHDKSLNILINDINLDLVKNNEVLSFESEGIKSNKEKIPIELFISVSEIQNKLRYILVIKDISQQKEQEKEVRKLNQRLVDASRQAGISEIAASILHNIGNVLNSVNTSVNLLTESIQKSRMTGLEKAVGLIEQNRDGLANFFASEKGSQLCNYLSVLSEQLVEEKTHNQTEIEDLSKNIKHIEMIIQSQQQHAHHTGVIEEVDIQDLVQDCINMNISSIENYSIEIKEHYEGQTTLFADRHKLVQIIVNLVRNAKDALVEANIDNPEITISTLNTNNKLEIYITDNGVGMSEETVKKLFSFGFTTKKDGHGYGLHSCSLEAKNMQGLLRAESPGLGQGASFIIELPLDQKEQNHAAA